MRLWPLLMVVACGTGTALETGLRPIDAPSVPDPQTPEPMVPPNPFTGPCLEVSQPGAWPVTKAGCGVTRQSLTVKNSCPFAVRLTSEVSTGPFGFASLPLSLEPMASGVAVVGFEPRVSGRSTGSVTVVAQVGPHRQRLVIPLTGDAGAPRVASLEYVEPVPQRPSVLLIVDDDGVFNGTQNFERMATLLGTSRVLDVAVSNLAGTLQAPDGVTLLRSDSPEFQDRFVRATRTSATPGRRSCLEAAVALRAHRQPAGFWEKPHVVVCITDEADASDRPGTGMLALWQTPPTWEPFSVIAPIGFAPTCGVIDPRFENLVLGTGGSREDLCIPGWSWVIDDLQRVNFGFRTTVFLSPAPTLHVVTSLKVFVSGVGLEQIDFRGARQWRYDAASHAVVLEPLYAPEPGQSVRLTWETCEP
jgi:hypothetical protein